MLLLLLVKKKTIWRVRKREEEEKRKYLWVDIGEWDDGYRLKMCGCDSIETCDFICTKIMILRILQHCAWI